MLSAWQFVKCEGTKEPWAMRSTVREQFEATGLVVVVKLVALGMLSSADRVILC